MRSVHPMKQCRTCRYWDGKHCCLNAPVVIGLAERVWSGWPMTYENDGCGEHKDKEKA